MGGAILFGMPVRCLIVSGSLTEARVSSSIAVAFEVGVAHVAWDTSLDSMGLGANISSDPLSLALIKGTA